MRTRRHQRSEARREEVVAGLVASCMAEVQQHAHEAHHFLVVSSIQSELAKERDPRDKSLDVFRAAHNQIESLIQNQQWQSLSDFVSRLAKQRDIFIVDTHLELETSLRELWQQFSGFGVAVASSVVWLAKPRIYYLLLWRD